VVAVTPMIANVMPSDPGFFFLFLGMAVVAFVVMGVITGGIAVAIVGPRRHSRFLIPAIGVFAVFSLLYTAFGGTPFALVVGAAGLGVAALGTRRRRDLVLPGVAGGVAFWLTPFLVSPRALAGGFGIGVLAAGIAAAVVVALLQASVSRLIGAPRLRPAPRDGGLD
jgi:hypothetical protein